MEKPQLPWKMLSATEIPLNNFKGFNLDDGFFESNILEDSIPIEIQELLSRHFSSTPLISNDVAIVLLKIQSKYLEDHPCLCTSRFRHTLHQLEEDRHRKLDKLCNDLQFLSLEKKEVKDDACSQPRKFYRHFLSTIFDCNSLHRFTNTENSPDENLKSPKKIDSPEVAAKAIKPETEAKSGHVDKKKTLFYRLESILARLVSDYRGIFAIEGECSSRVDDENHIIDHEHRKRHEEEDTCPEEIKLMKIACQELSLECSAPPSAAVSPATTPKKDAKASRPPSLAIAISPTNNNNSVNHVSTSPDFSDQDKDHHIHRYYSILRSQHSSKKGNNHSMKDSVSQFPSHHHHHHHRHHQSEHGHEHRSQIPPELQLDSPTSSHEGFENRELSRSPLKWSPNIQKSSPVFRFGKSPSAEPEPKPVPSTSGSTQRKRKDSRTNSEEMDTKKMSRSSSNILESKTLAEVCDVEMTDVMRKSKSYCEVSQAVKKGFDHERRSPTSRLNVRRGPCKFYVSEDEMSVSEVDHSDVSSSMSQDDSRRSLNGRFERDLGFKQKVRPKRKTRSKRSSPRPQTSRNDEDSNVENEVSDRPEPESRERITFSRFVVHPVKEIETQDSNDSSLSSSPSSPSSCSSNSLTSDQGHLGGAEEEEDDDDKDDDVTIRVDETNDEDDERLSDINFPRLRRASWDNAEPAVQDHQQQVDPQDHVVAWMPPIGLRRESSSSVSSDNDDFSTRHFKMIHSQKHLDPTHIQRLPLTEDSSRKKKLKQLNKELKSVRRKLADLEVDFELKHGYKPSQSDKQNNDKLRRLVNEQSRLKKQIDIHKDSDFVINDSSSSLISDDSCDSFFSESSLTPQGSGSPRSPRALESMNVFFASMVHHIKTQRELAGRPFCCDAMGPSELMDEKKDLKSALMKFSEKYGAPQSDEEKNITKSIYDRYLKIKRLIRKNSANYRSKEAHELQTIPEDLEIPLTLASPQHRINIEVTTSLTYEKRVVESRPSVKTLFSNQTSEPENVTFSDENLHALSRYELLEIQRKTREEKKRYRRIMKEKEEKYMRDNVLRRVPKEDKAKLDEVNYNLYKQSKAKLKLIEALLSKGRQ